MTRLQAIRSSLGSVVRNSRAVASAGAGHLGRGAARALSGLVGQVRWEPPAWGRWTGARVAAGRRHLRAHPLHGLGLLAGLAAPAAGASVVRHRPKPHYVTYTVDAPGLTEYDDNGIRRSSR